MPNSIPAADRRGAAEPGEIARPRCQQAGLGAVRPPQAIIDKPLAWSNEHHSRGLGRDHGLKMEQIDEPGFDKLRLRQRGGHANNRLVGKEQGTFGHGIDIPGKAKRFEIVQETVGEWPEAGNRRNVIRAKGNRFEELQHLSEPRCHQKTTARRKLAEEELENGCVGQAVIEIGGHHVQLVKIGEQRAVGPPHVRLRPLALRKLPFRDAPRFDVNAIRGRDGGN